MYIRLSCCQEVDETFADSFIQDGLARFRWKILSEACTLFFGRERSKNLLLLIKRLLALNTDQTFVSRCPKGGGLKGREATDRSDASR